MLKLSVTAIEVLHVFSRLSSGLFSAIYINFLFYYIRAFWFTLYIVFTTKIFLLHLFSCLELILYQVLLIHSFGVFDVQFYAALLD